MINRRNIVGLSLAALFDSAIPALGADPAVRLLFVHGRGQAGLNPADLQAAWLSALAEGAQAIGKALPPTLKLRFHTTAMS
jgi:hypothetical protein